MGRLLKWLGAGFAALLIFASIAAIAGYVILKNTVQSPSGSMEIEGVSAEVEIIRDRHGIPHIEGQTKADALAALGFAHAQDRLWQMEVLRMSGQGRLSEMFGNATIDIDHFLRTLGFLGQAEKSFAALGETEKAELSAYSAGVNAFMSRDTGSLEMRFPPEFTILGHSPEEWRPAHSLLVLKIMSLRLSKNLGREVTRLKLAAHGLSPAEIGDVLPMHRDDRAPLMPDLRKMFDLKTPEPEEAEETETSFDFFQTGGQWASNNWVFNGTRTQSGKPLLANDPHLEFSAPSLWYLAHLKWRDDEGEMQQVIGATIPALPAVLLGRNDRVAWGFTNAGADVQDLFIEQIDPGDPSRYKTPGGWEKFAVREEKIVVSGGETLVEEFRSTRHGPVLPGSYRDLENILPDGYVAALAWTGMTDSDPSYAMASSLAEARNIEEFRQIVSQSVAPMQSIVVADIDGNIALMTPARVPLRKPQNTMLGRAPVPGWVETYDWVGTERANALIDIQNPSSGALGSANSRLPVDTQDTFFTLDWDEPYRTDRVTGHVLAANGKQTVQDMVDGQLDSYSEPMVRLRDALGKALGERMPEGLAAWDGRMDAAKSEPYFMTAFHKNLLSNIFADELGDQLKAAYIASGAAVFRVLDGKSSRKWCDDVTTDEEESCRDVLVETFDQTREEIGSDAPAWGEVHIVFNEHRPFSSVWPLSRLFTIERPVSGGNFALLRAKSDFKDEDNPFRAVHGAGYRAVYDFSDLDKSIYIQTTGQSGNPFSSHYDDLADLWSSGRYIPMTTRLEQYREGATGTWRLKPAG